MSNEDLSNSEIPSSLVPLTQLARDALGRMSVERRWRGQSGFERRPRARRGLHWPVFFATAIATASFLLALHRARPRPLSYVIESRESPSEPSLAVGTSPESVTRFSDGTEVRVEHGAQARVRFVDEHGASLALARGSIHATVVHSASSEWHFDAGPYSVRVTGTEFGLTWDPDQDRLDVRMERGSVTVTGPVANDPIPVRAGQWLTIRARNNEFTIRELAHENSPAAEVASAPSAAPAQADPAPVAATDSAKIPAQAHHWERDLAQGKLEQIVGDALRRGVAVSLAEASPGELGALADAARYTRHEDLARKALLAERRRFPGAQGTSAAFFLGRLAEAGHDDAQASSWFDTYLREAANGPYASEALGRQMAIATRTNTGGATSATRALATQYLERFPGGAYAKFARSILNK